MIVWLMKATNSSIESDRINWQIYASFSPIRLFLSKFESLTISSMPLDSPILRWMSSSMNDLISGYKNCKYSLFRINLIIEVSTVMIFRFIRKRRIGLLFLKMVKISEFVKFHLRSFSK